MRGRLLRKVLESSALKMRRILFSPLKKRQKLLMYCSRVRVDPLFRECWVQQMHMTFGSYSANFTWVNMQVAATETQKSERPRFPEYAKYSTELCLWMNSEVGSATRVHYFSLHCISTWNVSSTTNSVLLPRKLGRYVRQFTWISKVPWIWCATQNIFTSRRLLGTDSCLPDAKKSDALKCWVRCSVSCFFVWDINLKILVT
jgi:hypothetical protein